MSISKLQTEILPIIRGRLSTSAFSAKLGYRFNQYARWEKGERRLLWSDFVAICQIRHLPIRQQVKFYLGFDGDLTNVSAFTKTLMHGFSIDEVSKATKISRSKISRWINGKASPTFSDVFNLLKWGVNVYSFFEPLIDLQKVSSLSNEYERFKQQRELAYTMPHLDVLREALTVRAYQSLARHDSKVLSRIAGLPVDVVDRSLEAMLETKQIEKKAGKYKMIELGLDYREDKRRMVNILTHWMRQSTAVVERSENSIEDSLVGFSVLNLSEEAHEKASTLFREFLRGIHAIGSQDKKTKEKVFVFSASFINAERFGES